MKVEIALGACVVFAVAVACGADRGTVKKADSGVAAAAAIAEEPSQETFALGTSVTPSGAVPANATSDNVVRGGEVYVSVDVRSSSTEQTIEVRWVDPNGRVLHRDARHVREDAEWVPFSSGRTSQWSRGTHRAVILIDGRTVTEKSFAVL
ncbi:MAG TPA: hypothetical protein VNI54_12870 [Thermoanaerobaculia bacterium]|nr:hypothetical protein [Thermoanaerobaculia bacterium]